MDPIRVVDDLTRLREGEKRKFREVEVAGMRFTGPILELQEGNGGKARTIPLGEDDGLNVAAEWLGYPGAGLTKLPMGLRSDILEFLRGEIEDKRATLEVDGGRLVGIWNPDKPMIPRDRVAEVIQAVMPGDAEVVRLDIAGGSFDVDIATNAVAVEPRVGDVTRGGLRVYSHVQPARGHKQQPRASTFFERLMCTNGMTRIEPVGQVSLRSTNADEIIEEMERVCQRIWGEVVPARLEQYTHLVEIEYPDDDDHIAQVIHRWCRENGIGEKIESKAIERIPALTDRTAYDIVNMINELQHEDGVRGTQHERLQEFGGNMAVEIGAPRCGKCMKRLD